MSRYFFTSWQFGISTFVCLSMGCGHPLKLFTKDKNEIQGQQKTLMKSTAAPLAKPNQYKVQLRWAPFIFERADSEESTWMILKAKAEAPTLAPWVTIPRGQSETSDTEVEAGMTYTYALGFWKDSQFVEQTRTQITLPKDLVVSSVVQAGNLSHFSRVFITSTGILETQGARLHLVLDELISEGGTIRTWDPAQTAGLGSPGINPDILVIQAKKASGQLTIQAIGQTGGKGLTGAPGAVGLDGLQLTPCKNPEENFAETGLPGYPGGQGAQGGEGGDSPKVYVEVLSPSNFDLKIDSVAGQGGPGGDGGPGGRGGNWINPDKRDHKRRPRIRCWSPESYVYGPSGAQGPQGNPGLPGKILPYCTKIQGKEDGQCSQFYERNGFIF